MIGTTPVKFEIDTGADLNIMEKETFNMLVPEQKLVQTNIPPLNSPGGQLSCVGKFQAFVILLFSFKINSVCHFKKKHGNLVAMNT